VNLEPHIARYNLALGGLHFLSIGLLRVADVLIATVEELKSAIAQLHDTLVFSESIDRESENWPELPKPAVQKKLPTCQIIVSNL